MKMGEDSICLSSPCTPGPLNLIRGPQWFLLLFCWWGGLLQYTSVETTGADAHEILRPLCEAALNWLSQNHKLPPLRFSLCLGFPIGPGSPRGPLRPQSPKPSTLRPGDPLHSIPSIALSVSLTRALILRLAEPSKPQKGLKRLGMASTTCRISAKSSSDASFRCCITSLGGIGSTVFEFRCLGKALGFGFGSAFRLWAGFRLLL